MLVSSIGYFSNENKVKGVDTSKVQAKPVFRKVMGDVQVQEYADSHEFDFLLANDNKNNKSVVGRIMDIFA